MLTIIGNGYEKWSGHFTAPLKGLFVFSCTVMAVNGHYISVSVSKKNGQEMIVTVSSMGDMCYGDGTGLKQRGQVWIRWNAHGRHIHGNYNNISE